MPAVLSLLRAHPTAAAVSTAAASDAAALAADMAAHPEDYALPPWVESASRLLDFLRSRNREALALKRRVAGVLMLAGGAAFLLRQYRASQARAAKAAALAAKAQAAAAAGGPLIALSPSPDAAASSPVEESLGDRLMHPPESEGLIPIPSKSKGERSAGGDTKGDAKGGSKRVAVDALFFKRLLKILRIAVPSVWSKEAAYLAVLTALLFARTFFSIYIAELIGNNAQSMVSRRWGRMWRGIKLFAAVTIPASMVNSGLKYFEAMVSLRFRKRLSEHVHEQYLDGTNFYKATNLGGAERIDNADQRVTADIKDFSDEIAALYASLLKPLLDVVLFTWKLGSLLGWQGPAAMHAYFALSAVIKKKIMPNLGKLVARESELEGFYRSAHNRLITNSEEVAFFLGARREKVIINSALQLICAHVSYARYVKALVGVFDGLLVKYYASIAGYCTLLSPFIFQRNLGASASELTKDYIRNSQYLGQLSTAVGQLVMVGTKLGSIAGYTSRVSELLEQVRHLNEAGNTPFQVKDEPPHARLVEQVEVGDQYTDFVADWRRRCDEQHQLRFQVRHNKAGGPGADADAVESSAAAGVVGGGRIELSDHIAFQHVDIVSPEGKLLVKDLNFTVEPGLNVMVTGPNGVGKSSLFRVIGELWPLHSGVLQKPAKEDILFIPQKPYLVLGTLRDQIIYPHERADMERLGVTDEDLGRLLAIVDPAKNITTEWTWDTVKDWFHALSGGQKQRVAMARLFYHRPKFAILDECTSAVSDEVEGTIYQTCRLMGITIFTVSHRPQLAKYHEVVLKFEGETRWSTTQIDSARRVAVDQEAPLCQLPQAASATASASPAVQKFEATANGAPATAVVKGDSEVKDKKSAADAAATAPGANGSEAAVDPEPDHPATYAEAVVAALDHAPEAAPEAEAKTATQGDATAAQADKQADEHEVETEADAAAATDASASAVSSEADGSTSTTAAAAAPAPQPNAGGGGKKKKRNKH